MACEPRLSPWTLEYDGNSFDDNGWPHTVFCVGNGYAGIRGNLEEFPAEEGQGTYLAGIYDNIDHVPGPVQNPTPADGYYAYRLDRTKTYIERTYVNIPNGLFTRLSLGGEPVDYRRGRLHSITRRLDLQRGRFSCQAVWEDAKGRITQIDMERFSSMASMHDHYVRYTITPLNHAESLRIESGIDGAVANLQYGKDKTFTIREMNAVGPSGVTMAVEGRELHDKVWMGVAHQVSPDALAAWRHHQFADRITASAEVPMKQGVPCRFDRKLILFTSHDGVAAPEDEVASAMHAVSFDAALQAHAEEWKGRWRQADLVIKGHDHDQFRLRFSLFHLMIAAPHSARQSMGAKGLTGEGYRGLCFWDTDVFMAPFFYHCFPEQGRLHLDYRHRTLPQARQKAAQFGYQGALYPWESAVSGHEECEEWIAWPYHQFHIAGDVAYSVIQYHAVTGDDSYLLDKGLDMLVETSRFWMSKAVRNGATGEYEIRDVAGPDESHCRSDNNAYTNNLVKYCVSALDRMLTRLERVEPAATAEALARLGVTGEERKTWLRVAGGLKLNFDPVTGLYEQCDGFFSLSPDLSGVMTSGGSAVARYQTQAINQPDVLMFLCLLGAPATVLRANWDFYVPRTAHTSSLGAGIHACLAARLGLKREMMEAFRQAAGVDVHNRMKNAGKGIHLASAGAAWLAAVQGIAGVVAGDEGLSVSPCLPEEWQELSGRLIWHGQKLRYRIAHNGVSLAADKENTRPIPVLGGKEPRRLAPGNTITW